MNDTGSSDRPVASSSAEGPQRRPKGNGGKPASGSAGPASTDQPTVISTGAPMAPSPQPELAAAFGVDEIAPGARVGHFELLDYVGGGGMGQVFRARDTRLARTVALKVLSREQAADADTLARFRNEARSAAQLNHQGIAQVYFVGEEEGLPFIAFEFIEGTNIRDLVRQQGPLSLAEAVSYTLQVAEALQHAAARNVVHRDIKPSNVLVTPTGRAKLIDLGLARLQQSDDSGSDLTASGVTLGTFDYISPEQARDPRSADVRSDIYSLGCTLFYMLAGRPPFPEGTVLQKLLQHQGDEPPDVQALRPELPDDVSSVLGKMMAKDPRRRFQDPSKLIAALVSLAERVGLHPVGAGQTTWVAPRRRSVSFFERQVPWAAPVLALVAISLLLHALWSSPAEQDNQLSRDFVSTPEEYVPNLPAPEPDPLPQEDEGRREGPPQAPPDEPTKMTGVPTPTTPEHPPSESLPPGDEAETMPPSDGGTTLSQTTTRAASAELDQPGLVKALLARRFGRNALRPEAFDARLSAVDHDSARLSAGPRIQPSWAQLRGDTPAVEESRKTNPPVGRAPSRSSVLIVDPGGDGDAGFTTLGAACSAATDGDVIELRFSGRMEEKPLTLANRRLTITAAAGSQPVVVFEPSEVDPIKYPRSMLTLTGSRLTLTGVALELNVPREVHADRWSMLGMRGSEHVRLEKCSLTIRNVSENPWDRQTSYHPDVAFFRLRAGPGAESPMGEEPGAADPPATVALADCIVRGEAVLLRAEDLQPVELLWENGLLATTESLLMAEGGERTPRPGENSLVELKHLTAAVGGGLCRIEQSPSAPHLLPTQVECADSILLATGATPGAVIEQVGLGTADDAQSEVGFAGADVFYERFSNFRTFRHRDPQIPPVPVSFEQWWSYWNPQPENRRWLNAVEWRQLPGPDRPMHTHTPADYALNTAAAYNPAVGAAADGGNAGFQAVDLPPLPPEPDRPETPNAIQPD